MVMVVESVDEKRKRKCQMELCSVEGRVPSEALDLK